MIVNNYYQRNDGIFIYITKLAAPIFYFDIISGGGDNHIFRTGESGYDFYSNTYDYKLVEYKMGKLLTKLMVL